MEENKKILVTGAAGFVGRKLCEALSDKGYKLRVLVRDDRYEEFFMLRQAEIYTGDLCDPDTAEWAVEGVDGVFHLASIVQKAGIPDAEFWDVHVTATQKLLKTAAKHGVRRFVHCSTIGVLGNIKNPPADEDTPYNVEDIYQVTKAEGEKIALEYNGKHGLEVTVVRPTTVYGPGDMRMLKLFKFIAQEKFLMIGRGRTLVHPVYVDDLVEGMILAYESDKSSGRVYILGGENAVTLTEWVELIAKAASAPRPSLRIPYTPILLSAILCETVCKPFGIEPPLFRRRIDFFIKNRAFSIERAKAELGYEPEVGLWQGALQTLAWYREQGMI